jgi:hypothetical protein
MGTTLRSMCLHPVRDIRRPFPCGTLWSASVVSLRCFLLGRRGTLSNPISSCSLRTSRLLSILVRATSSSSSLGATGRLVIGHRRTPGVIDLVLQARCHNFFEEERAVLAALAAGARGGGEGKCLATVAFDHSPFGTPPVGRPHLHVFDLVARLEVLDELRHCSIALSPKVICSHINKNGAKYVAFCIFWAIL